MPKISVIIPSYNRAAYITNAIGSVLSQTYQDFEVIIVDDGSTDNTEEIVKSYFKVYEKEKIRYFYQRNQGPGATRNYGIRQARGEYVAFLDADDVLLPNALKERYDFLENHNDAALTFTDYYLSKRNADGVNTEPILQKSGFLNRFKGIIDWHYGVEFIFNEQFYCRYLSFRPHPIHTNTVMVRKNVLNDIGLFRTDIFACEDVDLWLRISRKHKVGFVNCPTAFYYIDTGNSLLKNRKYHYECSIMHLSELIKAGEISRYLLCRKISNSYASLGYCYFADYNLERARENFFKSIQYNPLSIYSYTYFMASLLPIKGICVLKNFKKSITTKS